MTKTKHPITPAGARVLAALHLNPGLFVLYNRGKRAEWIGSNVFDARDEYGKPLASTIRKLQDGDYLEPVDDNNPNVLIASETGQAAAADFNPNELEHRSKIQMTARDVLNRLRKYRFSEPDWAWAEELAVGDLKERRVDALGLRLTQGRSYDLSKYLTVWAIEIKISKADFLTELADPTKREPAMIFANCFAFAAPAGMIRRREVPEGCGLLEVYERRVIMRVKPPWSPSEQPDWGFVARMFRRFQNGRV